MQRVRVHGKKGSIPGVTGSLAIHLQAPDDRKKVPDMHEMYVDIGAGSKTEAEKNVRVGDAITYADGFDLLENHRAAARGCVAVVVAARVGGAQHRRVPHPVRRRVRHR